jgi:Flp pilus assembly protein TadD/thiol-disulfide isomerase/thioredoxin
VSQSPVDDFSEKSVLRYRQGWRALNRLLHEDHSFSGNERNCAFLNCGGKSASFADVSSVTGFGFADDGRGLATADWDFDGDLDVWTTNRTAPRVRFLKNNTSPTSGQFVAFKLRGDAIQSNRDAIGARLELHLNGSPHPVRIRTLHAGEGFLSQSSNWIHFGIGKADSIEKLIIRWPGGSPQEIDGLEFGKFYRIRQGGAAEIFTPPADRIALDPSPQLPEPIVESVRLIVPPGLILPEISSLDRNGDEVPFHLKSGRPTIINIWASWCAPCIAELTEWAAASDALRSAGFEVIAFSTDAISSDYAKAEAATAAAIAKSRFPFQTAQLREASLRSLDYLQRSILDRWTPLPVPSTFLVDPNGEILAIYKGGVHAQQLIKDLQLANATPKERRDAGLPFAGRWVEDRPVRSDPRRVATMMLDHDQTANAISYLEHSAKKFAVQKDIPSYERELGDIYYTLSILKSLSPTHRSETIPTLVAAGDLLPDDLRIRKELAKKLHAAGRGEEAVAEMKEAIRINPSDLGLKGDLAELYRQLGNFAAARPILEGLVQSNPKNAVAHYYLAGALLELGEPAAAIDHYKQSLSHAPRMLEAANNLAWTLAAHPDASIRSADEAIALAQRLCETTKEKQPQFLDTYAVALANSGNFEAAIAAAKKAIELHLPENTAATDPIRSRIKLFEAGKPYRE